MSAPTDLDLFAETFLARFPWLARFGVAASKALEIKSANGKIEIAGGGRPASGEGHRCGQLMWNSIEGAMYYAPSSTAPYVAVAVYALPGPPPPGTPGTSVVIEEGSDRVSIDE